MKVMISAILVCFVLVCCNQPENAKKPDGQTETWDTVKVQLASHAQADSLKAKYPSGQIVQQTGSDGHIIEYFVLYHLMFGGNSGATHYYPSPSHFYSSPYTSPARTYSSPSAYRSSGGSSSYRSSSASSSYRSSSSSSYRSSSSSSFRSSGGGFRSSGGRR